jgi:hypothetical protein
MLTRKQLLEYRKKETAWLPDSFWAMRAKLPRNFVCWRARKGLPVEELHHRSLIVGQRTFDPWWEQWGALELESGRFVSEKVKLANMENGIRRRMKNSIVKDQAEALVAHFGLTPQEAEEYARKFVDGIVVPGERR